MFSQSTSDGAADADGDVRAGHRPRQRPGAGAEPRRAGIAAAAAGSPAHRRDHREGLARLHHGRAPDLAGRALRHALPVELRAPAGQGRTDPHRRRRQRADLRRRRVQHARLARSQPAGLAAADRHRRGPRHPRAERPGRRRRARLAAVAERHDVPALDQRAGTAPRPRTSSPTSSCAPAPTGRLPGSATSAGSSSARTPTRCAACSTTGRRWRSASSSGPAPTRSRPPPRYARRWSG